MPNNRPWFRLAPTIVGGLLLSCDIGPFQTAGGGTETETITAAVTLPGGAPASGAQVHIRPARFLAGTSSPTLPGIRDTITDAAGNFSVRGLPVGDYALEIHLGDSLGFWRILPGGIHRNLSVLDSLAPCGSIRGSVSSPDSTEPVFAQVYGLSRRVFADGQDRFSLVLPPGDFTLRLASTSGRFAAQEFSRVGVVSALDTALAPQILWSAYASNPGILFENNLHDGVDDLHAMAVLHALAALGEARLLGMATNSTATWSGAALDAINTFYNRPDVPIGSDTAGPDLPGTANYPADHFPYDDSLAALFPHDLGNRSTLSDAAALYRILLRAQPDTSVVVISTGVLKNLYNLMTLDSDLVARKVRQLVVGGGRYPSGSEGNFVSGIGSAPGPNYTQSVVDRWPTPITFLGSELPAGSGFGACLEQTSVSNPIRKGAELALGNAARPFPTLDPLAVLVAVRGIGNDFTAVTQGFNQVSADGSNQWMSSPDKNHTYLQMRSAPTALAAAIDALLCRAP